MAGGVYSALSGMRMRLEELDRLAADLANISTAGYKSERGSTTSAPRESFGAALQSAVDVVQGNVRTDFGAGVITPTGRELDVAIQGQGFFVIDTPSGPRYTRNGSFTRAADGTLTTANGEPVLGAGGPITLGKGTITVEDDGSIRSGGAVVGQLQVVEFGGESDLIRESGSRFRAKGGVTPSPSTSATVGKALEQSNVSLVDRMATLTDLKRGFESMQKGVSVLMNEVNGRAISELGRR